jgi:hypothetical protein
MRLLTIILSLVFFTAAFQSCEIINPAEKVPTYLHVDSFQFIPNSTMGSSSHKINSVWVYFDNQPLGAFDLPATVPILTDNPGVITLWPGVVFSGLKDINTRYPFYTLDTLTINPSQGQVINIYPKTTYFADTTLNVTLQDFDISSGSTLLSGDTGLVRTGDPNYVFEGGYSGLIYLDNQQNSQNVVLGSFPAGKETFLELDYKGTLAFGIGVQAQDVNSQFITEVVLTVKPKATWNKLYVGLQDFISKYPTGPYRIVITVSEPSPTTGFVALDNLKVISRK